MKIFLRNTHTGMLYAGPDKWTKAHDEALDFEETNLALDEVSKSKMEKIEVLVRFDEPAFEIPLKVIGPAD
jgi:hypothetical protein